MKQMHLIVLTPQMIFNYFFLKCSLEYTWCKLICLVFVAVMIEWIPIVAIITIVLSLFLTMLISELFFEELYFSRYT